MPSPRVSRLGKSWTVTANMLDARVFESNDIFMNLPHLIISLCGVQQRGRWRMDEFGNLVAQVLNDELQIDDVFPLNKDPLALADDD